ncbi:hypothetical protein BS78_01G284600 [Paspalum vaginatum]|nr:hypothetical protein BS78_01G284600 [Paspalum vaginatum]
MNLLSWNCRSLGRSLTVQELVCLVQTYKPKIVFLSETRQQPERIRNLKWRIGLRSKELLSNERRGLQVELKSLGERHFDVLIRESANDIQWGGIFVYGEPKVQDRSHRAVALLTWTDLFTNAQLVHLISSRSDHCPLLLHLDKIQDSMPTKYCLRYEIMWETDESLLDAIKQLKGPGSTPAEWMTWEAYCMSMNPELLNLTKETPEMNSVPCSPYSDEEIGNALFQIGGTQGL